ncbi:apolipoprotein N-acyltransferase [Tautonia sociabilis]|uniref:Apolipoprotein N-acyltransferase n=1 Tax=Tautonia sociabilis TaxID=2080755 RepID=A0A432MEU9_9BACT|nr:apolipoprotein N-acyltransferase [Tautonia sociabilis]RUL84214.1 apolipoprotein N-acyltransferase [Tautonia sociabilis]
MSQTIAIDPAPRPSPAPGSIIRRHLPPPAALGLASGLLLAMAYEPVAAWWLAWVALVPLLLLVRSRRSAAAVSTGAWLGGLTFWLISVEWVRSSDESAWPGWLALAIVLSCWWPVALGLMRVMVRRLGIPLMIAAPAAWIGVEYVRGLYPLNGFPWFFLGHSTYRLLPLIQVADLAGAWALGVLVMLVNAWIVGLIEEPRTVPFPDGPRIARSQVIRAAVVVGAIGACLGYGVVRLATSEFQDGPRIALIQSDIPQIFGGGPDSLEVLATFRRLVDDALSDRPDLVVWPETMFPYGWVDVSPGLPDDEFDRQARILLPNANPARLAEFGAEVRSLLHDWTNQAGVPMIVGITSYVFRPEGATRHNTALLLEPGTEAVQMSHKLHLVPFGEYVPLVETIPWVLALTPFDADHMPSLDPGPGPGSLRLDGWRFASAICFEDSVPHVTRLLAGSSDGDAPDILLNLSNDGWFRGTAAHQLHLANSVLRAVELRVPVARAVNTGISAVIDGNGVVRSSLPPPHRGDSAHAAEGVLTATIPLDPRTSLYARFGDWLPLGCLALTLGCLPVAAGRSLRARLRAG